MYYSTCVCLQYQSGLSFHVPTPPSSVPAGCGQALDDAVSVPHDLKAFCHPPFPSPSSQTEGPEGLELPRLPVLFLTPSALLRTLPITPPLLGFVGDTVSPCLF